LSGVTDIIEEWIGNGYDIIDNVEGRGAETGKREGLFPSLLLILAEVLS